MLYNTLDNIGNLDIQNTLLGNPELLTAAGMSILGFYLCKNHELQSSLQNRYIIECLSEYGMSISLQVHVRWSAEKRKV